jgi:hypothetical protein
MVFGPKQHVAALLPHIRVERDVYRELVREGDTFSDAPQPTNTPAVINVGYQCIVLADQGGTLRRFNRDGVGVGEWLCAESGEDRFLARQLAPSPAAARGSKQPVVARGFASPNSAQMIKRVHAPSPPAIWRSTETSSKTVKSSTILPPRRR